MEWKLSEAPVGYPEAVRFMEERVAAIAQDEASGCVWLLEHPPLYTAGTSAKAADLLEPRFPVYTSGRGGQYTYHGPGQRVAYVLRQLPERDLRLYIHNLEEWVIRSLSRLGVRGERRDGRVGIWVVTADGQEEKIAAIGVRVRRWVAYHGVAINVNPDLSHFAGIVPCGIHGHGVTSLQKLGLKIGLSAVDEALRAEWGNVFES